MIKLLYQGQGTLSKTKRKKFSMLSDGEITEMESAYSEIFRIPYPLKKSFSACVSRL